MRSDLENSGGNVIRVDGLQDQVAVVSGAAGGIGRAIVESLVENGAHVAALDLEIASYDGAIGLSCDVSDADAIDAVFTEIEERLGTPAVLVMNAGIFPIAPFEETSLDLWDRTIAVNLTGAFLCAQRVLPGMRHAGYGRLVAMGSSAGVAGGARSVAAYAAAKAGVMTLAKSIANEYAAHGITSNALAPALIDTPMIDQTRDLVERIPVGRLGRPEEVAALVTFLCSSDAGYITGEIIDINGGFLVD